MQPRTNSPKPRGIPLWGALTTLLALAAAIIVALVVTVRQATNDKARLEKTGAGVGAGESCRGDRTSENRRAGRRAFAQSRQAEVLAQVRIAGKACSQLLHSLKELEKEANDLRTSEAGQRIARFPDLVVSARRLYQTDIRGAPSAIPCRFKIGGASLEGQLVAAIGTAFEPDANFASTAQSDANWANQESAKAENARTVLSTLIEESKIKTPPAGGSDAAAVTLEAAMANLGQSGLPVGSAYWRRHPQQRRHGGRDIANAEADRILSEAKLEAARIRDAAGRG